ncbi:MAG: hypothetical protein FJ137_09605 [Deltaproteobacteria bacterium]|nr:hypothetical protein [Deltaproteobacteria bacterium]
MSPTRKPSLATLSVARARAALGVVAVVAVVTVGGSGCRFGEAAFSTSFDDVGFDPGGTVFATLDGRDQNLVEDGDPRVAVAMTWVVFDPAGDLSDLDGAALSSMAHEMAVRDALTLVFANQGEVDPGARFLVVREGGAIVQSGDGDDVLPGLDFRLHVAPERLDAGSTYAGIAPFGSRRTLEVTIDEATFGDTDPVVAGELTLTFDAIAGRDAGDAREGSISGAFRAPLVVEAVAEKNAALLAGAQGSDAVLALPLPPRGEPL